MCVSNTKFEQTVELKRDEIVQIRYMVQCILQWMCASLFSVRHARPGAESMQGIHVNEQLCIESEALKSNRLPSTNDATIWFNHTIS